MTYQRRVTASIHAFTIYHYVLTQQVINAVHILQKWLFPNWQKICMALSHIRRHRRNSRESLPLCWSQLSVQYRGALDIHQDPSAATDNKQCVHTKYTNICNYKLCQNSVAQLHHSVTANKDWNTQIMTYTMSHLHAGNYPNCRIGSAQCLKSSFSVAHFFWFVPGKC